MSKYEDYDRVSGNYNNERSAVCADTMAAMIQFHTGKPLKEIEILDVGCGTGNYAKAFVEYGVDSVSLLDASQGMLDKARENLLMEIEAGKVKRIVHATMPPLPFPDNTFDAVMFNMVLHHLDNESSSGAPNTRATMLEACRVTKPSGIIAISTALPAVFSSAFWIMQLNPKASARFEKKWLTVDQYDDLLADCNLKCLEKMNILGRTMWNSYPVVEDGLSLLKATSVWSFMSENEKQEAEICFHELKRKGELETWKKEHDRIDIIGGHTLVFAKVNKST